jgi:transcription initiation factor TFIID subunit 11
MSLQSASVVGGPKKRGRKKKAKEGDDESIMGGKAKSAVSAASGGRKRKASVVSAEEEEDDDDMANAVEMVARTDEEREKEQQRRHMLVSNLTPEQFERYEAWRSAKLSEATTRRVSSHCKTLLEHDTNGLQIVNQTLSQSVPGSVILAIRSVAKLYAGDIIEGARKVQAQWAETDEEMKAAIKEKLEKLPNLKDIPEPIMNEERHLPLGPIEPDHLREAHRRYKNSNVGGGAGQLNLWQQQSSSGVERFASRCKGKRLFK